jgi:Cu(I)/Ag(I) efflux system membrane fusion protein
MTNSQTIDRAHGFLARHWVKIFIGQAIAFIIVGLLLASIFSGSSGTSPPVVAGTAAEVEGPTMWTCSMHPQIRQPAPGKCPICAMDLIPIVKSAGGMRTLAVSPEARALMNVQTVPAERKYVENVIRMVGKVDFDETRLGYITAWVAGRLDRMFIDYTGVEVKKGHHLVDIYSEELYSAQQELIQALKFAKQRQPGQSTLLTQIDYVASAREKLRLLGLTDDQIKAIEEQQKPSDRITVYSPVGGIVIEKLKQQGERVRLGERIYTIADLSQVWVHLDAYEADIPWVKYGQEITFTTEAHPGEEFKGQIVFIQPVLNDRTRTVKVRVNVPNPGLKLKPDMFVHGVVRSKVAAGGRVMDSNMAGKWISPHHPEIIKDEPGKCDICGMPLVRAETFGFVAAELDEKARPLVIPYTAALYTGTRAIVYVELPNMHGGVEPRFQTLSTLIEAGELDKIRDAFASFSNILDQPYNQPGTDYAKRLWHSYADKLAVHALAGKRAKSLKNAENTFAKLEKVMSALREDLAPPQQPTFEGREIILGERAGNYYIVRHGLQEGELVVTHGNFKIDAEVQIQAKPSMMTPEGGGGGGHDHGGHGDSKKSGTDEHPGHKMELPVDFQDQIHELEAAYQRVTKTVNEADLKQINAVFGAFGEALSNVDGEPLTGHPRMVWKEFAMLLSNDVFEGRTAKQTNKSDEVYLLLKGHMRRVRDQLGVKHDQERVVRRIEVPSEFQSQLAKFWQAYMPIQQALAGDDAAKARQGMTPLRFALAAMDDSQLSDDAKRAWHREHKNLTKILGKLEAVKEIKGLRAEFSLLSDEMSVLVRAFGFGEVGPVFELHCPMAFDNRGAIWFQNNDKALNPYFGATMLRCADRVEQVAPIEQPSEKDEHKGHEGHKH